MKRIGLFVLGALLAGLSLTMLGCPNPASLGSSGTDTSAVTAVTLNKSTSALTVGATDQLVATVLPATAPLRTVSWNSTNTSVATVSATGLVTAVSAGSANIVVTSTSGAKQATCQVTVTAPAPSSNGILSGTVLDYQTGAALSGVTLSSGSSSATSDSSGRFTVPLAYTSGRAVVNLTKNGYAEGSRIILADAATDQVTIQLAPVTQSFSFSAGSANTLSVSGSTATVTLPANSLRTAGGSTATGTVSADVTVINPNTAPDTMPGDFTTSTASSIESYGAMNVVLRDASGAPLNLGSGSTSTVRIPVPAGSSNPPSSIPLFYYNTATGAWVEEGSATLTGTSPNQYYQGTVTHFSTWNCDRVYDRVTIKGTVKDTSGALIAGATVTATGLSYSGSSSAVSAADGTFSVYAKASATVLVKAVKSGKSSNTVSVSTGASGSTYTGVNLIISDLANATVRLTWGQNPSDLDSHMTGPTSTAGTRFHTYFGNKGSLTASPWAALDVDDMSSFGPEVITLTKLLAGTYRYSVHHYSGSSTIAGSPARVELNLNGSVQVFSPPSGFTASGDVWGVFEIVVSSTGSATVNTLNTVSHSVSASAVSSERDLGTSAKLPMTADEEARF